jgi:hypothetical protein
LQEQEAITCNITSDDSKFYTASSNNQMTSILGIGYLESIYNFYNAIENSTVYEGMTQLTTTVVPSSQYELLEKNDDRYLAYTAPTDGQFSYQRFEIKIDEFLDELTFLQINWTGRGSTGGAASTAGYVIYFLNFTSGSWVQLVSASGTAKGSHAFNYTGSFNNLVNSSGYVYVLARSLEARATGGGGGTRPRTIETDYVHVKTRSDIIPPEVSLNYPDELKTNNHTIQFSCFVHDDNFVKNVTLYGNWSGSWHANETNSSGLNDVNYTFIKTISEEGVFRWNCYSCDKAGNCEFDAFEHQFSIDTTPPSVNLFYPSSNLNSSTLQVPFNFSVSDNNSILNCSLFGNFNGSWHPNQSISSPQRNIINNFSSVNLLDGYYYWNVRCLDDHGNFGWNSTNFSFAAFLPPYQSPQNPQINQSKNDGTSAVNLSWQQVSNAVNYKIYYTDDVKAEFQFLNQTSNTFYEDTSAPNSRRRFYKISAWNPTAENETTETFAKTIYSLNRLEGVNTRNWANFYINNSNYRDASSLLTEINNVTVINMWDASSQKRVSCNSFSCPTFPECTDTNCNFEIQNGVAYEVNINSSAPLEVNWSTVGKLNPNPQVNLSKKEGDFGKNWVGINPNSSIINASSLFSSVPFVDAVTEWNTLTQSTRGLIPSPFPWIPFIGTNFIIMPEKGYEVSVIQNSSWQQN